MRSLFATVCLVALPYCAAAQELAGAQTTFEIGTFGGDDTATFYRGHADAMLRFGRLGVQASGTYGADDLADLQLIGFRDFGSRWRIGAEIQTSTDAALDTSDFIWGLRMRYSDAGGTVDTRGGLVRGGPDGAFFVTVAMDQQLGDQAKVRGMLHRYSTNDEVGDFFAIGLGGDIAVSDDWSVYADGIWALSDDFLTETTGGTLGLRRTLGPNRTVFAGISGYGVNGEASVGLTAGLTLTLDRPGTSQMFQTDPWGMQLAQIGY